MSDFTNILQGLGGLLGGMGIGGAGSGASRAQERLLRQMAGQYQTYVPQLNRMLLQLIQSGGTSPALEAAQRQAEADTDGYFRQALAKMLVQNERAGLGTSLQQQNATLALARARAGTLAQQRAQRLAEGDDRVWRAMQLLGGSAGNAGSVALSGYGRLGDDARQQAYQTWATILQALDRVNTR